MTVYHLIAIRRQARVMAGHSVTGRRPTQIQSNRLQSSVIKTMILVSALYTVSDLPGNVYYLMLNIHANGTLLETGYYAAMFVSFLYFCTNPLIYATKFDPVKETIMRLFRCNRMSDVTVETIVLLPLGTRTTSTRIGL